MENITKTNSQKQEPIIKPSVTTSATFNPSYVRSLKVLSMSNEQLFSHFRKVINHNPFIEYLPHKVYKDNQLTVFDYMQQEKTLQDDLLFQLETYRGTYSSFWRRSVRDAKMCIRDRIMIYNFSEMRKQLFVRHAKNF